MASVEKIKPPMQKVLAKQFIELYCKFKENNYPRELVVFKTMYKLQEIVISYIAENPHQANIIITAYESIKHDTSLHEKALTAFELSKCPFDVKEKYMHLVQV